MDPERIAPPIFRPEHSAKRMALTPEAEEFSFIENLPRFYGTSQEMDRAIELIADLRTENATLAAQAERYKKALRRIKGGACCPGDYAVAHRCREWAAAALEKEAGR